MKVNRTLKSVRASPTVTIANEARQLIAAGRKIIDLTEGQPDFDTPEFIVEAAYRAALDGQTRYTAVAGTAELRQAISRKFRVDNGFDCEVDNVVVGNGGKQLIFNAMMVSLDAGDEVLVPAPYWVSYPDIVKLAGGVPVIVPTSPESGFRVTAAALRERVGERTRWLLLNSPCNPTGTVLEARDLEDIAEFLRAHPKISVMCDDIYEKIVFDGRRFSTMAQVAPDLGQRILTVNGVSKSHAMTGWRIGYAAGPRAFVAAMIKFQGQSTTNASSVSQAAALAALTGPGEYMDEWCEAYERKRDLVSELLSASGLLRPHVPQGAFYSFVDCRRLIGCRLADGTAVSDDADIAGQFLKLAGVAVIPGSAFGCPGFVRLCFAKEDRRLRDACLGMLDVVDRLT
ncbi:MAG: pyridoxal phosphate-dependent aminotransferase [Rhodobacteraceae bacterium]|nr:pyridoxal phosphate-dependent aminotransferase [Paracoccaceae bacterium]